jgi:hypothetical protein
LIDKKATTGIVSLEQWNEPQRWKGLDEEVIRHDRNTRAADTDIYKCLGSLAGAFKCETEHGAWIAAGRVEEVGETPRMVKRIRGVRIWTD